MARTVVTRALVTLVVPAMLTAGCATGQEPPPAPEAPPAPEGLTATVEQSRSFALRHMLQVVLDNGGSEPVEVTRLQLVADEFEAVPPTVRDAVVEPGRRVSMPIDYGVARCDAPSSAAPAVVVQVEGADVSLPLPNPDELLTRLHASECGQRAVAEAVEIVFGPTWTPSPEPDDMVLRGSLIFRRLSPGEEVTLEQMAGTVIFDLRAPPEVSPPLLRLDPGTSEAELAIDVSADRCDPHALIESKRSFLFPLWVSLDGAEPQYVIAEPQGEARRALDELLAQCAQGG
jgi:hypothetical protein